MVSATTIETPDVTAAPAAGRRRRLPARGKRRLPTRGKRRVPERSKRGPVPIAVATIVATIAGLGLLAVFVAAYALGFSGLQEQRTQHELYAAFRGLLDPSNQIAPSIGGVIAPGTPIAVINAPQASMRDLVVVEGTSSGDLLAGPGHLRDSPLPGQPGQSIVMGKSLTAGAPFGKIDQFRSGDPITVVTGQGTFRFVVEDIRRAGDAIPQLPASGGLLTFVTTEGSGWLGKLAPDNLVYVDAALQQKPVAAPPGRLAAVPAAEVQGNNDPSGWPFIVFWLQAFLLVGCSVAWLWSRWGHWQTWLIGAPLLFGVLWGVCTEAMDLLPNVM